MSVPGPDKPGTGADLLREAAERLRAKANEAQHKRPWCPEYTWAAVRHVQRNVEVECADHGDDPDAECFSFDMYDGHYVAMMHPPVALALADWLDLAEQALRPWEAAGHELTRTDERAVAVARAVLREGES